MFSWFGKKQQGEAVASPQKKGLFEKLKEGLFKTKSALLSPLKMILGYEKGSLSLDQEQQIQTLLLRADLGPKLAHEIVSLLKEKGDERSADEQIRQYLLSLAKEFSASLDDYDVLMLVGINGAGKTTTIAKLAQQQQHRAPMLIAADSFRAAAIEQLEHWAQRIGVELFKKPEVSDPAAIVFAALEQAGQGRLLMIDTAGRLNNNKNLMNELAKIKKVILKKIPQEKVLTLLVLDGHAGQHMITQAKSFQEQIEIDGLIVTKLDGTSRAGAIFEVIRTTGLPVAYVGCGEGVDDLYSFEAVPFVDALLAEHD
jgi:fused signal recognition particle receptor